MKKLVLFVSVLLLTIVLEYSTANTKNIESSSTLETIETDINNESYCQQCCKKGTWTDSECCKRCNNCQLYSDGGTQECGDFPH